MGFGLAALVALACGGTTVSEDGSGGTSGQGGSAASGGTSATGGAGGSSGGTGGAGGAGGRRAPCGITPPFCNVVGARYQSDLMYAKKCNPFIDYEQCTVLVPWELPCGCPTFVSSGQQLALADLVEWQEEWKQSCCNAPCPPCAPPDYGTCEPTADGTSGSCVDHPR
jgi:hypothetical protein